jgi:hypothetical protein
MSTTDLFPATLVPLLPFVVLAVLGIVQFIKTFGLTGRVLTGVSFVVGALYGSAIFILPPDLVKVVVAVSLFGLAASGLYDFGSLIGTGLSKMVDAPKKTN